MLLSEAKRMQDNGRTTPTEWLRAGVGVGESPSLWWLDYTLVDALRFAQQHPTLKPLQPLKVTHRLEPRQRGVKVACQGNDLELLAHLAGQGQAFDFGGQFHALVVIFALADGLGNAQRQKETGLGGVAGDFQSAGHGGLGGSGEIDEGRKVGQARPHEGVEVGAVAVVADQRAPGAVGMVVLG